MHLKRHVGPILAFLCFLAVPLAAQNGSIRGQVIDSVTQQGLAGATVQLVFRTAGLTVQPGRQVATDAEGRFTLNDVAPGTATVKVTLIGFGPVQQEVTVTAGATAEARFALSPQAAILEPVVVTGYGSQRREAITGSVATVDANTANVGVKTNADQLLQGRAAGVNILQNSGEPGSGSQVLIRGGSSLSATNDPLYVIDGVPINNVATEPDATGVGGAPALARNPLNLINPGDIQNITVLKDASATAIYGSRASNGVVLIETKKGNASSGPTFEYDGNMSTASPARRLDVLNGAEYRAFVTQQVANWRTDSTGFCGRHAAVCAGTDTTIKYSDSAAVFAGLQPSHLGTLGSANTDWASAITRSSVSQNHNLSFSGGTEATRYRASLNYAKQEGVTLSSGLERIQGRLSATHADLNNRLRMELNVTTSRVNNTYLTYENNGGFEGGVFENVATFNPTLPVTVTDSTGTRYYEVGGTSIRNPVALANQIINLGQSNRTLANGTVSFDLTPGLTAKVTVGLDHVNGQRQEYFPLSNPVGQAFGGGFARQATLANQTQTIQTVMNYQRPFGGNNTIDVVGGYEYSKFNTSSVTAEGTGFFTDAFSFNNLNAATTRTDFSDATEARLASFFGRANIGLNDRFYFTGVLRYDGSSRFAEGHKWAAFPGISGSWHLSRESFAQSLPFSDLKVRLGWGLQGNPSVDPYTSLITLAGNTGAAYPWGDQVHGGVLATSNGNPDLKWEQTSQIDGAVDFAIMNNRISGSLEYYHKNTKDLLLTIDVPQPALNNTQLKNVGSLAGHGLELTLDALAVSRPSLTWRAGLVFAAERTKVVNLGGASFISTGFVSGQGQSNQVSERLIPGEPIGTFYGPVFLGVDASGKQVFRCTSATPGCVGGRTTTGGGPDQADYAIIGNANPDFTLGFHSEINWNRFDLSFLVRAAVGQDVFNNTALVYSTKGNALQDKNFLRPALSDPTGIHEPAIFSSRWVENASFVRLQNITVGYDLNLPVLTRSARSARLYLSADNLILITGYSGLDPEVFTSNGLATRGLDYLTYPRPRTITGGLRLLF
ncbi:MAG TPA: SusC/RagA family TonB-linked outer membrane protein [Gemmatimonadales bacterium]|nr:SusC/RagA family TonB-linked outer membrane protein [Gemmatimonadales bacterium]